MKEPLSMFDLWHLSKFAVRARQGDCPSFIPPEERQAWCAEVIREWEQAKALLWDMKTTGRIQ